MALTAPRIDTPAPAALNPAGLAARLLDKAMACLEEAIGAIECNDIETRCNTINLASEIVTTLHLGLDFDNGGETADRLGAIYRFVMAQLIRINLSGDETLARRVCNVLTPLRDAWQEVDRRIEDGGQLDDLEPVIIGGVDASSGPMRDLEAR